MKQKKAIFIFITALVIILSAAQAEVVPLVANIDSMYIPEWNEILDTKITYKDIEEEAFYILTSSNVPDILVIPTSDGKFNKIKAAGLLEPFLPSEQMKYELDHFPPIVLEALKNIGVIAGEYLYAYPSSIYIKTMLFWVPDAWDASPFKDLTPPSSYNELLDFIEIYLSTPHEGFCFYYDIFDSTNPLRDWIQRLIKCWIYQCRYEGLPIDFTDQKFIESSERTIDLITRLLAVEPNRKRQKGHQLFTTDYKGYTTNGDDTYSWNNLIPWRIDSSQRPLVLAQFALYCASRGTPWAEKLGELFSCIIEHRNDLYEGHTNYLEFLFADKDKIDVSTYNQQIQKKHGSGWKCLYMTQEYIDSIWEIEKYARPCVVQDEYISRYTSYDFDEAYFKAIKEYTKGSLSTFDFACALNACNDRYD